MFDSSDRLTTNSHRGRFAFAYVVVSFGPGLILLAGGTVLPASLANLLYPYAVLPTEAALITDGMSFLFRIPVGPEVLRDAGPFDQQILATALICFLSVIPIVPLQVYTRSLYAEIDISLGWRGLAVIAILEVLRCFLVYSRFAHLAGRRIVELNFVAPAAIVMMTAMIGILVSMIFVIVFLSVRSALSR